MSAGVTAEVKLQDVMELMWCELQAQLDQNLAESCRREQEAQKSATDIAAKLEGLP